MSDTLISDIIDRCHDTEGLTSRNMRCLAPAAVAELAETHARTVREVEIAALHAAVCPERYERNMGTLGPDGQSALLGAAVAVIGAGGLGGHVIDQLARMGVGKLVVVDGDVFAPSNLNRQLLSSLDALGRSKAETARNHVARINPAVEVDARHVFAAPDNLDDLLAGCDLAVDALDHVPSRFHLEAGCARANIPLIHAAIAGYVVQATVIHPGDPGLAQLYGEDPPPGAEKALGTPPSAPAAAATVQAAEAVKIILGRGETLRHKLLIIDLWNNIRELVDLL